MSPEEKEILCCSSLVVNRETEDEFNAQGYKRNTFKMVLFYLLGVLTVGLLFLLAYWYPLKRLKYTHDKCSLKEATVLLIKETEGAQLFISDVKIFNFNKLFIDDVRKEELANFESIFASDGYFKYFEHKFLRYYINSKHDCITELSGLDNILQVKQLYDMSNGITLNSTVFKIYVHNENYINVPVRSYAMIFFQFALNPFYVFQVFSVTLWYNDDYIYYASIIVFMTLMSLIINTYETKSHMQKLHNMVGKARDVKVVNGQYSGSDFVTKSSHSLVPGDVLIIPHDGFLLPCDAVLLNGRCIVNESTLTGESFPTTKTPIDSMTSQKDVMSETYSVKKCKRHTLYNGTEILQGHFYGGDARILAVVVRTGFCTLKGRLIRSIIHPKPVHFSFFRDSMKFILFVGMLASIGFIYALYVFIQFGESASVVTRKALDVFTIAVPPALPACMSVGLLYALHRLRKSSIFCIDPARVNVCGKIKLFVFDKTGTLTEDILSVSGLVRANGKKCEQIVYDAEKMKGDRMIQGMACCHSLTIIKDTLTGDPLDMYMFNFTKWSLHEPSSEDNSKFEILAPVTVKPPPVENRIKGSQETDIDDESETAILKQYPFESSLQRMSVITRGLNDKNMVVYTKGSPEMILSMCLKETVPDNLTNVLFEYTKTGSRVIAIATKDLPVETKWHHLKKLQRSDVECDLKFLGLIVFENVLKPNSKDIIETLEHANIRTVMATGDNLYTAASVAREVRIVHENQSIVRVQYDDQGVLQYSLLQSACSSTTVSNESINDTRLLMGTNSLPYCLAMTGDTYIKVREKFPELLPKILISGSVFARMSPDQKTFLVEDLKTVGYGVGMCGDGANDCGALKAAHAGIALSDTEASIASPFTSKVFDISCVPRLLKEGRAALVTSFGIFKYMALYSFIQFMGVLILYSIKSNYSDFEFLYADLPLNLLLCFTMIQSKACKTLDRKRPLGRLVHPMFIGGILLQTSVQFFFQFGVFKYVQLMAWYKPPSEFTENDGSELYFTCYENTSLMIISFFQYIWLALVFSSGKPYRQPLYTNWKFCIALAVTTIFTGLITVYIPEPIREILQFAKIPSSFFTVSLLFISLGNLYISYVIEKIFIPSQFMKRLSDRIRRKKRPKNPYKHIHAALKIDTNWPTIVNQ